MHSKEATHTHTHTHTGAAYHDILASAGLEVPLRVHSTPCITGFLGSPVRQEGSCSCFVIDRSGVCAAALFVPVLNTSDIVTPI